MWYRALHAAACLLLALLLSGCAVLAVSPEVREVFTGWVREAYENAFVYLSGDLPEEALLKIAESVRELPPVPATHIPTWLPPGYRNTSAGGGLWSVEAAYENEEGERLQFRFARRGQAEEPYDACLEEIRKAAAGLEGREISVDGCPGRLYLGDSGGTQLIWGPEGGRRSIGSPVPWRERRCWKSPGVCIGRRNEGRHESWNTL